MKKNILVVGDFITGSGLTSFIFNVFDNFSNDYKISAVGYGLDGTDKIEKKCQKKDWNFCRVIPVTKNPIKHWLWWKRFFKNTRYDIIYFNYSSAWNYLPLKYAVKYQKATVVSHSHSNYFSHTFKLNFLMNLLKWLNKHGQKIFNLYSNVKIATSKDAAIWMFNTINKVHIINNGIRISKFRYDSIYRNELRKKYGVKKNEKLIGFVGVMQLRKNPIFALRIFYKFHLKNPNSKFVMIGKGPIKDEVIERIKQYNLKNKVILIDYSSKTNKWYSAMDALVFPSRYEGFGLVALEAQVSNLPVLASNNVPETVFVTQSIRKESLNNTVDDWVIELENMLNNENNRCYINKKILNFDAKIQAEKIKNVLKQE